MRSATNTYNLQFPIKSDFLSNVTKLFYNINPIYWDISDWLSNATKFSYNIKPIYWDISDRLPHHILFLMEPKATLENV